MTGTKATKPIFGCGILGGKSTFSWVDDTYSKEAARPPTVTETSFSDVGKGTDDANCSPGAKPVPKMAAHVPGASVALYDAPLRTAATEGAANAEGALIRTTNGRSNVLMDESSSLG